MTPPQASHHAHASRHPFLAQVPGRARGASPCLWATWHLGSQARAARPSAQPGTAAWLCVALLDPAPHSCPCFFQGPGDCSAMPRPGTAQCACLCGQAALPPRSRLGGCLPGTGPSCLQGLSQWRRVPTTVQDTTEAAPTSGPRRTRRWIQLSPGIAHQELNLVQTAPCSAFVTSELSTGSQTPLPAALPGWASPGHCPDTALGVHSGP